MDKLDQIAVQRSGSRICLRGVDGWTALKRRTSLMKLGLFCSLVSVMVGALHAQSINFPSDPAYYQPGRKALRAGYFYVDIGVAQPMGRFGELPLATNTILEPFAGQAGTGGTLGYVVEFGTRHAFRAADEHPSRFYPFWGLGLSVGHNPIDWSSLGDRWTNHDYSHMSQIAAAPQLGLALKSSDRIVIEIFAAAVIPVFSFHPEMKIPSELPPSPYAFKITPRNEEAVRSVGFTGGLGIRTRKFRLGAALFQYTSEVPYTFRRYEGGELVTSTFMGNLEWNTLRVTAGILF